MTEEQFEAMLRHHGLDNDHIQHLRDQKAIIAIVDRKDAEIERLKGICDTRLMHICNVLEPLVGDLADALARVHKEWPLEELGIDAPTILQRAAKEVKS